MHRYLLATTAALAIATPAAATTVSTKRTDPLRTSTINNGAADAITLDDKGSVVLTAGTAVTMDSDNAVTNGGAISVGNAAGGAGIVAAAGTNGDIVNTGTITVDESYTPTDSDNDGDLDGPFAIGANRFGIRTDGAHTGKVTNGGTITVEGNQSAGIWLGGPLTGTFTHSGKTLVTGDNSVGVRAGDIAGNVRLAGSVTAQGANSMGAQFTGNINGALVVQGAISATGYRATTAPSNTSKLDADDLLQGGSALVVEGDVTGGILLAVAPADTDSAKDDEDGDGIKDAEEGNALVTSFGAAPAMVIGAQSRDITIGSVAGTASGYGLIVDGVVAGKGVYPGVDGNGLVIGGRGGAVTIAKGIGIAGSVTADSAGANATALRLGAGAATPEMHVSGTISATGAASADKAARALVIDTGASLPTLRNSGTIKAAATGKEGVATAILDQSGGLALIENSGTISATGPEGSTGARVAIDLSANATGATIRQTEVAAGKTAPAILGDVRFGAGNDRLEVADGTVAGTVTFGSGANTLALSGDARQSGTLVFGAGNDSVTLAGSAGFNGTADFGGGADTLTLGGTSYFSGTLVNATGLAVNVTGGVLDITKPASIASLNVGASGTLVATLDKTAGAGSLYSVSGTASFAKGSQLALRISDTDNAEGHYVVLEAGSLEGVGDLETTADTIPFMFKAKLDSGAPANQIAVDISRRTTAELGLNRSQSAAYGAIFQALGQDDDIEQVFLGITDGDQFRSAVRQLLPDHAGGVFEGLSLGARAFARRVADPQSPVYSLGGLDVIVSSAFWSMDKSEGLTSAYDVDGLGFSAAGEVDTGLGAFGVSASWLWNETTNGSDNHLVQSDTYELAAYWRGNWGGFTAYGRGSYGLASFRGRRSFFGAAGTKQIERNSTAKWDGTMVTFSGGASYESGKYLFFRPAVPFDYTKLDEDGYTDKGGGKGLDLVVADRKSDEFAANGGLTVGVNFLGAGRTDSNWFRVEGEGGWREIVGGSLGATTAHFAGGEDFTLDPEQPDSGWYGRLRAVGGSRVFEMSGEAGAEKQYDGTALSLRGTLRMAF
ncbi:transporter [Altererythrobacter sp. B11]|uniref:autotransporter outer membrane beta-barrel domain-containing protein n=1 Tax=Altererythrobacter sp. B11 TaxID=2060312 RepID=UPI000DC731FD|nr:autotransporter domain-containing protein [Altererythrobacter sp. B11]BBC72058.1 transporter [Altererythrobacter sp. B11]